MDQLDDEMKQVMELSMNEFISGLEKSLPPEPKEGSPDAYNIQFRYDASTFTRRFNGDDYIRVDTL